MNVQSSILLFLGGLAVLLYVAMLVLSFFFFLKIFLTLTIKKVFIEFVTVLLLLYVFFFLGHEECGILAPCSGIEPTPSELEGEVLITGPPGKSVMLVFIKFH